MEVDTSNVANQELDFVSMDLALKRVVLPKNKMAIIMETDEGTRFCCVQCPMRYDTKEKLEFHLCSHFKEFKFLCGICGTGLKRKEHLDRHLLGHQGVRPHVCEECGKGFKRKEHLNIHRSIHSGDKTQVCPLCQRSFYRKDHLQKHLQTHNKLFVEQNIFPLSDQELVDIKQEVFDEDVKPVINAETGEIAEMDEAVQKNMIPSPLISLDPQRPHACSMCGKTYKRKDHLKLHYQTHLKKDKTCSECGKGFHREEQLLAHMSVHLRSFPALDDAEPGSESSALDHDGEQDSLLIPMERGSAGWDRPHECPVCGRKFKRKQHLKVHANVHLKPKPAPANTAPTIWCSLCHEGFVSNSQFESHQCQASNEDEMEEQAAAPCDAKKENDYPDDDTSMLSTQDTEIDYSLEQHLPTPQRVYVCKYCNKPFKRKDHYKIHLHVHTGIKSFFCPDCGKGFYRKDHLQKHTQVHLKQARTAPAPAAPIAPSPGAGAMGARARRAPPPLYPISMLARKQEVRPEITITAPSNTKLRVPLQIKVPYQMVLSMDNGEQRAVTIDPQANGKLPLSIQG